MTATSTAQNLLDSAMSGVILVSIAHFWFDDAASFGAMVTGIGLGALAGTLRGSVSPGVLHHATSPVLVVRHES